MTPIVYNCYQNNLYNHHKYVFADPNKQIATKTTCMGRILQLLPKQPTKYLVDF